MTDARGRPSSGVVGTGGFEIVKLNARGTIRPAPERGGSVVAHPELIASVRVVAGLAWSDQLISATERQGTQPRDPPRASLRLGVELVKARSNVELDYQLLSARLSLVGSASLKVDGEHVAGARIAAASANGNLLIDGAVGQSNVGRVDGHQPASQPSACDDRQWEEAARRQDSFTPVAACVSLLEAEFDRAGPRCTDSDPDGHRIAPK